MSVTFINEITYLKVNDYKDRNPDVISSQKLLKAGRYEIRRPEETWKNMGSKNKLQAVKKISFAKTRLFLDKKLKKKLSSMNDSLII